MSQLKDIAKLKKEILKKTNKFNAKEALSNLDKITEEPSFLDITEEEKNNIKRKFARIKHGASVNTILICPGNDKCPHWESCPYKNINDFHKIIGQKCPVETELFVEIVKKMTEEYGVESTDYIVYNLILEYAELEILDMRVSNYLADANKGKLIKREITGMSEQGPIFADEINKALDIKNSLSNRKKKILDEIILTPKGKIKARSITKGVDNELQKYKEFIKTMASKFVDTSESLELNEVIDAEIIDEE